MHLPVQVVRIIAIDLTNVVLLMFQRWDTGPAAEHNGSCKRQVHTLLQRAAEGLLRRHERIQHGAIAGLRP